MRSCFLVGMALVCGCGGSDRGGGGRDSGPVRVDSGPAGVDSGSVCEFVGLLDPTCDDDADCAHGIHQTDCCGSSRAVGFRASERERFDTLEPMCAATYPGCGCPAGPTQTDSGETVLGGPDMIRVACVASGPRNVCLTYVSMRPPGTP